MNADEIKGAKWALIVMVIVLALAWYTTYDDEPSSGAPCPHGWICPNG